MLLKIVIVIVTILILGYFGVTFYIAEKLTKPASTPVTLNPSSIASDFENVEFKSSDNFLLKGWLFKNNSDKIVIMVPGFNSNRENNDYGGVEIVKELLAKGYGVLMFDRRTTGESQGNRVTFGGPERFDVIAAVDLVKQKGFSGKNIAIIADSLGAISTLMALNDLKDIGPIVSDSGAAEVKPVVERLLKIEQHLPSFLNFGILFWGKVLYGINMDDIKPIELVKQNPERVILFLHEKDDQTIPYEDSVRLQAAANPQSKLVQFTKGEHIKTYKTEPELYRTEVFGFIESQFGK